jgi:hypothetical protein
LVENTKQEKLPAMKVKEVLSGIEDKIEKNPLLREVILQGRARDFNDLIEKFSGEKVMMAVQLVESYNCCWKWKKTAGTELLLRIIDLWLKKGYTFGRTFFIGIF